MNNVYILAGSGRPFRREGQDKFFFVRGDIFKIGKELLRVVKHVHFVAEDFNVYIVEKFSGEKISTGTMT